MKTIIITIAVIFQMANLSAEVIRFKFNIETEFGKKLQGTQIRVYEGNRLVTAQLDSTCSIRLKLHSDRYYTIEVAKMGYIAKRISVNTTIGEYIPMSRSYRFTIMLEREAKYSEISNAMDVLDYPAAHIEFDVMTGYLDYNKVYWKSSQLQMAWLRQQRMLLASVHREN